MNTDLFSKFAAESGLREETERRTGVYMSVHEDSSTVSTKQSVSAVEFGKRSTHIVVVAGEESGDLHASHFIAELKNKYKNIHFSGIGGRHMEAQGIELISDVARYAVTGISEVLMSLNMIRKAFVKIKKHLTKTKPDLLILVDYPSFNLRLAKFAKKKLGLKILYYISPQIWAWKAQRINLIKQCVDHMAVILPFEKLIYSRANIPVSFVGHPLTKDMPQTIDSLKLKQDLKLPLDKKLIAFLPGSRINEIQRHMPVLIDTALKLTKKFNDLHFVVPVAGTINPEVVKAYFHNKNIAYSLIKEQAVATAAASDFIVVASGTASLECALLAKPMCIIYKVSLITAIVAARVIKVRYLGLCNLLMNSMIAPEFLQYDCNAIELEKTISQFLNNPLLQNTISNKLKNLKSSLSHQEADLAISELIEKLI